MALFRVLKILWWVLRSRLLRKLFMRVIRLLGLRRVVRALFRWVRRWRDVKHTVRA